MGEVVVKELGRPAVRPFVIGAAVSFAVLGLGVMMSTTKEDLQTSDYYRIHISGGKKRGDFNE